MSLSTYLSIYQSIYLSIYLSTDRSTYLSTYLCIYIYIYTYYGYLWNSSCITYLLVYTVDIMPGDHLQGCSSDSDNASERAAPSITTLELTVRGEDTYRCWGTPVA